MDLSALIAPEAVRVLSGVASKKRLFQELSEMIGGLVDLEPGNACAALQERESLGPTGVGGGIALPHARIPGLERVYGLFIRLEQPLDFDAVDRQPVDLVFALFAPENAGADHLKALASVSRTMRSAGLCAKLRANDDPTTLYAILTDEQSSRAA